MRTGPPEFVGVGAQRAGTSWWFRVLTGHPDVRGPRSRRVKELHFFTRFSAEPFRDEHVAAYHHEFPRTTETHCGEWTPGYMAQWWAMPLLHRSAPDAKILVILRDPIERYRSGVVHILGYAPKRPMEAVVGESIEKSRYARGLERVLDHYPREQVMVLQYERCRAETDEWYRRTLKFIGVEGEAPLREEGREGDAPFVGRKPPKPTLTSTMEEVLHAELDPDVRRLVELAPEIDLSLWPHFSHLASGVGAGG